ncbi:MAG: type II secretion system F family protein [Solirubrobacteraceae bacterium]
MNLGVLCAGAAAMTGVAAVWSALGALDHGVGQLLAAAGPDGRLARLLAPLRAGREATRDERRRLVLVAALSLLVAGWLLAGPLPAVVLAAAAPLAGSRVLAMASRRRRDRLAAAAPAVARAIADALAGGHSIRGALGEAASGGVGEPAAGELRTMAAELALGGRTEDAIERWRARAGHAAYDAIAAAVLLQREAGGDLSRLLRGLAEALEEQVRAEADARGLTAQARFTAMIVAVLPLVGAGLAELGRPGYLAGLIGSPLSAILVLTSFSLQILAWIAVRRISRLRG